MSAFPRAEPPGIVRAACIGRGSCIADDQIRGAASNKLDLGQAQLF